MTTKSTPPIVDETPEPAPVPLTLETARERLDAATAEEEAARSALRGATYAQPSDLATIAAARSAFVEAARHRVAAAGDHFALVHAADVERQIEAERARIPAVPETDPR